MERHVKSESVNGRIDRRMFLIWWATRNLTPKDRNAVAGKAIAGIAIAGRNESEEE